MHHEEVAQLGREEVAPPHASRGMDTPKANEVHHEEVVQLNPKPEQQDALQVLVELLRGSCMRVGEWIPRQPTRFFHEEVVQLGRERVKPPHASRGMDTPKANGVHHEKGRTAKPQT